MGSNYVQYKARVLQMLFSGGTRRIIAFSVDIPMSSSIGIKSVTIGGVPMAVVFGGENDINALVDLLSMAKIAVEIPIHSSIDVLSTALGAQHVITELAQNVNVDVSATTPAVRYVTLENMSNAISVFLSMNAPQSIETTVNAMPTVSEMVSQLVQCSYNTLSIVMDDNIETTFALHSDSPIDITGTATGSTEASITLRADGIIEMHLLSIDGISISVSVKIDTDWIDIHSDAVELSELMLSLATDESKSIESSAESSLIVVVASELITGALLSDYDADTLSEMDTYTLDELKHKIQHN